MYISLVLKGLLINRSFNIDQISGALLPGVDVSNAQERQNASSAIGQLTGNLVTNLEDAGVPEEEAAQLASGLFVGAENVQVSEDQALLDQLTIYLNS